MINKINTLYTVANKLTSHLILEGKTKITKPGAIIPGAAAAAGITVTLETKENSANLIVEKDNKEIQRAIFNYNETPDGYELVSATSSFFYDDKEKKEIQNNHYMIEPLYEKFYERSVNYQNAPLKKDTQEYIEKLNSSLAKLADYKSGKTDYDSEESHTYGKKSLQRDIPALLKFLEIVAPDSEFTLKMKDKLKKDNTTSLIAFEVSGKDNSDEIVKGFVSTSGDSISYRINTKDMIIIGEQSSDKDVSKAYLKQENTAKEPVSSNDGEKDIETAGKSEETASKTKPEKPVAKDKVSKTKPQKSKKETKQVVKEQVKEIVPAKTDKIHTVSRNQEHVYTIEYYINSVFETATNDTFQPRKKAEIYKEILSQAYLDGYDKNELETILGANGLLSFSSYCKKAYVEAAIELSNQSDTKQPPVKTIEEKIKDLQKSKFDIDDDGLKVCIQSMFNDISKIKDDAVKEEYVNKALNIVKNSSKETIKTDLISFAQELSKINDDLKLHFEIYNEFVNNQKVKSLKSKIEQMINNISDIDNHQKRNEFLTKLYVLKDLNEFEQLQKEVQNLLNGQTSPKTKEDTPVTEQRKVKSLESLSSTNQKIVKKLLSCKSPRNMAMSFGEIKNLLLNMGFIEGNVSGSHHKFIPPADIYFNGKKQTYITVTAYGVKTPNPAQIDDLINICKQYYGSNN